MNPADEMLKTVFKLWLFEELKSDRDGKGTVRNLLRLLEEARLQLFGQLPQKVISESENKTVIEEVQQMISKN